MVLSDKKVHFQIDLLLFLVPCVNLLLHFYKIYVLFPASIYVISCKHQHVLLLSDLCPWCAGIAGVGQRGYSSAVASASAGLTMPYSAAAALSAQQQLSASYPINPDVKLKKLPFYDILAELLKPSSLGNFHYLILF